MGTCGWEAIHRVDAQNRATFALPTQTKSIEWLASVYAWIQNPTSLNTSLLYTDISPRSVMAVIKAYGMLPSVLWSGGIHVPSEQQFMTARNYKAREAYDCLYVGNIVTPKADKIPLIKELICKGLAVVATGHQSRDPPWWAYGGDVLMPPDGTQNLYHAVAIDGYDDDAEWPGSGGVGCVTGATNGQAHFRMSYAMFEKYWTANAVTIYAPPSATFPFSPLDIASLLAALQTLVNSWSDTMPTQSQIDQAKVLTAQLSTLFAAMSATQPPIIVPPPATNEIIVDALPPGESDAMRTFTGVWKASGASGAYGANGSLYSGNTPTPDGVTPLSTYTFKSPPLKAGNWQVYVWWTVHANRSQTVPITAGGVTKTFNQQADGSRWALHGVYQFGENEQATVTISNANGQAAADAVRFVSA
jgi:hypothetical protein